MPDEELEVQEEESQGKPEPQEETTTEEERIVATAALVAAENAEAPTQEELDIMFAPVAPDEGEPGEESADE